MATRGVNKAGRGVLEWMLIAGLVSAFGLAAIQLGGCRSAYQTSPDGQTAEWSVYGSDFGGTRYSKLTQINRGNVSHLKVAWTYRTGEAGTQSASSSKAAFEATPIVVDGTLYLTTPFNRVIALDPETGKEQWKYDPKVDLSTKYGEVTSRGVATWRDSAAPSGLSCARRILVATIDARLIALDATSGVPCKDFGQDGQIDLTRDVRLVERRFYQQTSPPAVIGDLIIVGSSISDNRAVEVERGVVGAGIQSLRSRGIPQERLGKERVSCTLGRPTPGP